MKKVLTVLIHLAVGLSIQLYTATLYIFGAEIPWAKQPLAFVVSFLLIAADDFLCRRLSAGKGRLIHLFDLPLLLAPCGLIAYVTADKLLSWGFSGVEAGEWLFIFGVLVVETGLVLERLALIRAAEKTAGA